MYRPNLKLSGLTPSLNKPEKIEAKTERVDSSSNKDNVSEVDVSFEATDNPGIPHAINCSCSNCR